MNSAILFLVFNRPDTTSKVFEAIRKARPARLYVAADGPRKDRLDEVEKVAKVRDIATSVDWPCKLKTLFHKNNLGCKYAVSTGIDWFFEQEEQGIILEDDCLPHQDFFSFCDTLLKRYAFDERVWNITGNNFQNGIQRGKFSYYFSYYNHVWGWASWRRAWKKADMDIKFWPKWKNTSTFKEFFLNSIERKYWEKIFDQTYHAKIDTWDYSWTASTWYHKGLTATPNVNLVSNIGFRKDATHTKLSNSPLANMTTSSIGKLQHPETVTRNPDADNYVLDWNFLGYSSKFPHSIFWLPYRITKFFFHQLKKIFG